ncbi:MAG: hypothetical protein KC466_17865, partial [Myxococcales bacterium]|nr:hypothetical protein [Myxococcales bacterium]
MRVLHLMARMRLGGGVQDSLLAALPVLHDRVDARVVSIRRREPADGPFLDRLRALGVSSDFLGYRVA